MSTDSIRFVLSLMSVFFTSAYAIPFATFVRRIMTKSENTIAAGSLLNI